MDKNNRIKVLFIGAHPDDIEIGCGGTIFKHRHDWDIHTLTFCGFCLGGTHPEIIDYHHQSLDVLEVPKINRRIENMKPSFLYVDRNQVWSIIKEVSESKFDVVFTHTSDDHQDHRTVYEETTRVFQNTTMYCYHIPRSQNSQQTQYYEVLSKNDVKKKISALDHYVVFKTKKGSLGKCFNPGTIKSLCRTNALYIGEEFSENFSISKIVNR